MLSNTRIIKIYRTSKTGFAEHMLDYKQKFKKGDLLCKIYESGMFMMRSKTHIEFFHS